MTYILETERLRMREFTFDDVGFIIELLNSPGWLEFIGDRNVRTPEQARDYLENGPMKSYRAHGYGLCIVEKKDNGIPVGMCGLLNRDAMPCPDIGFAFLPAHSGRGYAFEMAKATTAHAKDKLGLSRIAAITVPGNDRSIRLLMKLGMVYVGPFKFPRSEEVLSLYETSAQE